MRIRRSASSVSALSLTGDGDGDGDSMTRFLQNLPRFLWRNKGVGVRLPNYPRSDPNGIASAVDRKVWKREALNNLSPPIGFCGPAWTHTVRSRKGLEEKRRDTFEKIFVLRIKKD